MNENTVSETPDLWHPTTDYDDFYQVAIHRVQSVDDCFVNTQDLASWSLPITDGPDLRFMSKLTGSRTLRVIFHGAIDRTRDRYPRFDRVGTSVKEGESFLSFADPTLALDESIRLAWYVGAQAWDPLPSVIAVVQRALQVSGAEEVIFIGGSGGGFASLRAAANLPGSKAFVFSPQTSAVAYRGGALRTLLQHGFEGVSEEQACEQFPGRFNVVESVRDAKDIQVYYLQNLHDSEHISNQYNPLRREVGVTEAVGPDPTGRFMFVLADFEREGHAAPTSTEFQHYFKHAREWFDSMPDDQAPSEGTGEETGTGHEALLASASTEFTERAEALEQKMDEIEAFVKRSHRALTREIGLLPWHVEEYHRAAQRLIADKDRLPQAGSYALRADGVAELVALMDSARPETVVECGSGASTVWIASMLRERGSGHLVSVDHDEYFMGLTQRRVEETGLSEFVTFVHAPLVELEDEGTAKWYDFGQIAPHLRTVDFLLVDGPPASAGPKVRTPALHFFYEHLAPGAVVAVDDATRPAERAMVDEWIDTFGLKPQLKHENFAVLEVPEQKGQRHGHE